MFRLSVALINRVSNKFNYSKMSTSVPGCAQVDLSDMRKPYRDHDDGIDEAKLDTLDPIKLFSNWFELVKQSKSVYEPNAFSISTVNKYDQLNNIKKTNTKN